MSTQERKTPFKAGEWTVVPEAHLLVKGDQERHVEPKVMKVLLTLAERQGHVYTKEDLIAEVWPNTFVSDDALTRCISILRRVTEDDAHEPRFIQTIPKVGYRLVAPLSEVPVADSSQAPLSAIEQLHVAETSRNGTAIEPLVRGVAADKKRFTPQRFWPLIAFALILAAGAVAWFWRQRQSDATDSSRLKTTAFTGDAGEQMQPAFSPDGKTIAYARTVFTGGPRRIYLKQIGSQSVQQFNQDEVDEYSPAWSPDGKQIAYLGRSDSGLGIYVTGIVAGRVARKVFIPQEASGWEQGALSWSPDGKSLAFPDHMGNVASSSIYQLELVTLRTQVITSPPAGAEGDLSPAYSPDGRMLAFTRASETEVRDIYWKSLVDGTVHQLTHDRMNIDSFTWDRDSTHIIFSSNRAGKFALWRIGLRDKGPVRMPVGTEDATQPASGPLPSQLAYTRSSALWSIDRIQREVDSPAQNIVISSTQEDSAPTLSPDDSAFAFQSRRSGNQEIWIALTRGDQLIQLTSANGPVTGSPSWSHHGDRILYDSRPDGHSHIFVIPTQGGPAKQLTFGNVNDIIPRWSVDDKAVYFRSNRGGRWQIWRVASEGGEPQPVTREDGMVTQESPDGRWLYYSKGDASGIWRVPMTGGTESLIVDDLAAGYWGYWQVAADGIYYLDTRNNPSSIRIYDPETHRSRIFAALQLTPPPFQGMSVYKDGRAVLLTRERDIGRHITLVERVSQ